MQKPVVEIDFYTAIRKFFFESDIPVSVEFTHCSFEKNEGGEIGILHNQKKGPKRKNINERYMIGLEDAVTDEVRHIYLHSILYIIPADGTRYKLILN